MSHLNNVILHRLLFFFNLWRNGNLIICNELFRQPHLLGVINFKENFCAIQNEVFINN